MDVHEIGNRIKQARTLRNFTLDDIANDIGVAKSTIQRYENGLISKPKLPVLQAIANSLNVNPAWISGQDVPMNSNLTLDEAWDRESSKFEDKINSFYYQLKGLGWYYNWSDDERLYTLTNGTISFKITDTEFSSFVDDSQIFCKMRLEKLYDQSKLHLFPSNFKEYLTSEAAHERTDIEVTDEMRKRDDDIMHDDKEWE